MRIGRNDRKVHTLAQTNRITAAVVTFAPHLQEYFQDRLEVIRLSLISLVENADLPLDLMVFDNASCPEVVDMLVQLKKEGIIRWLIMSSENVGLVGAYQIISQAAPGEIIAFANDDVYYFPNWLSPMVEILDNLPDVGIVSGFYLRGTNPQTAQLAVQKGLKVSVTPAPDTWIEEFCRDASYETPEAYYEAQKWQGWTDLEDKLISNGSVKAYAGGVTWQAVFRKDSMQKLLPCDDPKKHNFKSFDSYFHAEIIRQGYLRLSTPNRLVRHMGNVIKPEIAKLAKEAGLKIKPTIKDDSLRKTKHFLLKYSPIRKRVVNLYNYLYKILHI